MPTSVGQTGSPPTPPDSGGSGMSQLLAWTPDGELAITDGNEVPIADNPVFIAAVAAALQQPGTNIDPDFDLFGAQLFEP